MAIFGVDNADRKIALEAITTYFVRSCKVGTIPPHIKPYLTADEKTALTEHFGPEKKTDET